MELPISEGPIPERARRIEFPEKLMPLFQPFRYKVAYGGRGGLKSWSFARALLILGRKRCIRVLCAREIQNSIKESVHKLLELQIKLLGFQNFYTILETEIRGANGTEIIFKGLRKGFESIPSLEDIDIAWVEEANKVSKASWDKLIPTIRKSGSEIWISFNPELEDDETYVRFIKNTPSRTFRVKMSYADNIWLSDELKQEAIDLWNSDRDSFHHIWGGNCRRVLDGAIYAKEIMAAEDQGRICEVPYDPRYPVDTFWDLGHSDNTSIWFRQRVGFHWHYIHFFEDHGHNLDHYAQYLQRLPYSYGVHYLPHDGAHANFAAELTVEKQAKKKLPGGNVRVVPSPPGAVQQGIDAMRVIFPMSRFDINQCADGLNHLRRYCYDIDAQTKQRSRHPKHDDHCHAADAIRISAFKTKESGKKADISKYVEVQSPKEPPDLRRFIDQSRPGNGWLGN